MVECSFKNLVVLVSSPVAVTSPSDFAPASSKEFLDIRATIECGFALKRVRDMTRTYSQMHHTDSTQNTAQSFGQFDEMIECLFKNEAVLGSSAVACIN